MGTPLCATVPLPTGFTGGFSSVYPIFLIYSPERRSNSAQHLPPSLTHLRSLCASSLLFPILISELSPGPRHCAPGPHERQDVQDRGAGVDHGVPGSREDGYSREDVYPPWYHLWAYREVHTHHGTGTHHPPWYGHTPPTMVPGSPPTMVARLSSHHGSPALFSPTGERAPLCAACLPLKGDGTTLRSMPPSPKGRQHHSAQHASLSPKGSGHSLRSMPPSLLRRNRHLSAQRASFPKGTGTSLRSMPPYVHLWYNPGICLPMYT